MLSSLTIHNIVLIEKLHLDFQKGLCALTGETGAGKSILLDALGLALGARSESRLLRSGQDKAQVIAEFEIPRAHPAHVMLHGADLESDQELVLRRVLTSDGRSKAYINDQPVSAALLKSVGQSLVEIHGQFDTQLLLDGSTHCTVLDDYAGHNLSALHKVWQEWQQARSDLEDMQAKAQEARAEETYLREALEDLDALEPKPGEEETLAGLRERLMNREQVLEALNTAYHALSDEDDPVRSAWGAIDRVRDKIGQQGDEVVGALERATAEISEAVTQIQSLSSDLENEEHDLQSIDDRLFALRGQARKHNCAVDDLAAMRDHLAEKLDAIEHEEELLAGLMKQVESAKRDYEAEAKSIHDNRLKAAQKMDELVAKELPPLKLERATFVTEVNAMEENEWNRNGISRVQFLIATNPGAPPGPLNKIASGGEMARFMLALKVVMAERDSVPSMIFDEVDAGVGGATADAVGERLAQLGKMCQVMVVTHSPQVAARAASHWIVSKQGEKSVTTTVQPLESEKARQDEIARMLAGAEITPEARAAANKLLEMGKQKAKAA